jgi:hypothetical protein
VSKRRVVYRDTPKQETHLAKKQKKVRGGRLRRPCDPRLTPAHRLPNASLSRGVISDEADESEKITVAVRADDLLESDTATPERH